MSQIETEEEKRERVKKEFFEIFHYGHPRFYQLIWAACEIHEKKNRGYATTSDPLSNFRECEGFGVPAWQGALVRMSDKWSRIKNLAKVETATSVDAIMQKAQLMESITDTLFDLSVYSLIDIILYEDYRRKKDAEASTARNQ